MGTRHMLRAAKKDVDFHLHPFDRRPSVLGAGGMAPAHENITALWRRAGSEYFGAKVHGLARVVTDNFSILSVTATACQTTANHGFLQYGPIDVDFAIWSSIGPTIPV